MPSYRFNGRRGRKEPRAWLLLPAWALGAFVVTLGVGMTVMRLRTTKPAREPEHVARPAPLAPPPPPAAPVRPSALRGLTSPTGWDLSQPDPPEAMLMPTASGNLVSALFGSTRTGSDGRPRFHAGVDIAPRARDRRGRPTDPVLAVAEGRVAYVNRSAGGSSYGVHVVLLHDDPAGAVYTMYAHLASVVRGLAAGDTVAAGEPLGVMGNTASTGIPMVRAHLHFEIGVLLSGRFGAWARERGIRPDRGNYHGWNFVSVDPLEVFRDHAGRPDFSLLAHLGTLPPAFELALHCERPPEYFRRHPRLWQGAGDWQPGVVVLAVSEGGVVLSGRPADGAEAAQVEPTPGAHRVLRVDTDALGRNGMRLIERQGERWTLGSGARRWLELLRY